MGLPEILIEFKTKAQSKFYIGGVKKFGILLIVAVATQLDTIILGETVILGLIILWRIVNERLSLKIYGETIKSIPP